jgi:hypothetical protein
MSVDVNNPLRESPPTPSPWNLQASQTNRMRSLSNAAKGDLQVGATHKTRLGNFIAVVDFVTHKAPRSHKDQQGLAVAR